jgi:hypothetical protein
MVRAEVEIGRGGSSHAELVAFRVGHDNAPADRLILLVQHRGPCVDEALSMLPSTLAPLVPWQPGAGPDVHVHSCSSPSCPPGDGRNT